MVNIDKFNKQKRELRHHLNKLKKHRSYLDEKIKKIELALGDDCNDLLKERMRDIKKPSASDEVDFLKKISNPWIPPEKDDPFSSFLRHPLKGIRVFILK